MNEKMLFTPKISAPLARLTTKHPLLDDNIHEIWGTKIAPHTTTNPDITVIDDPKRRLSLACVGVESTVEPAGPDKIRELGSVACPQIGTIIDTYKCPSNEQRLRNFARLIKDDERKKNVGVVFEHSSLMNLPIGSMALMAALYELKLLQPGDVQLNMAVSDMLKHAAVKGVPIIEGFMDGLFQYVQFLQPKTDSVSDFYLLSAIQDPFNRESLRQDLAYQNRKDVTCPVKLFCPSAEADKRNKKHPETGLHMAPFDPAYSMLRRLHLLSMGLDPIAEPPVIHVGGIFKPLTHPQQCTTLGYSTASGMTRAGSLTTYHENRDAFRDAIGRNP